MKKLLVLLMLMCVASASAQEIAYDWDGLTGYVRTNGVCAHGNIFEVTSNIEVTKLGSYNYQYGNETPDDYDYPIELYEIDALVDQGTTSWSQQTHTAQGTLLASVTIGPATAGDVENIGAAQYITLDSPVILTAGKTYILNMDSSYIYTGISDYLDIVATNVVIGSAISHQNDYFTYQGQLTGPGTLADNGTLSIGHIGDPTDYWVGGPTMIYDSAKIPSVIISADSLTVEEGEDDYFSVELDVSSGASAPGQNVEVTVNPDDSEGFIQLDDAAPGDSIILTFTPGNWDSPKTVTVHSVENGREEGNRFIQIDVTTFSNDPCFSGLVVDPISLTVTDDDWAGDVNQDGSINLGDLSALVERWLDDCYPVDWCEGADLTAVIGASGEPGKVDVADFAVLVDRWHNKALFISEFMASNSSSLPLGDGELLDGNGQSSDWIEIHNAGSISIELEGYYLTDKADNLTKWQFPAGVIINAGEYLIVFASNKDQVDYPGNYPYLDPDGYYHTNFKLSADGEYLALVEPDGQTIVNDYDFPAQETDVSFGLYDNQIRYFGFSTPGLPNNNGYLGMVADSKFSHSRGYYDTSFDIVITCDTPGANIRYTADGSSPTDSHGKKYEYPGNIPNITTTTCLRAAAFKPGWLDSNINTHTYFFLDDIILQPSSPSGFPATWTGYTSDYEMDPEVITDIPLTDSNGQLFDIKDALLAIPTMSITTDVDDMFGPVNGIYTNAMEKGINWERPASVEYIDPNSEQEFQVNCGIRIHGGWNRFPEVMKKSFRLYFRSDYGPTMLEFPLFPDSPVDSFDQIVLRSGNGFSWGAPWGGFHIWNYNRVMYIRDQYSRDIQREMGRLNMHGNFVHLYINGLYWGLYNATERATGDFLASHMDGGEAGDYDAIKWEEDIGGPRAVDGDMSAWNAMKSIADGGLSSPQAYQNIQQYLDVQNLIDYCIVNMYGGNHDWDHNWYAGRKRQPGEGFKFFAWDTEGILINVFGDDRTGTSYYNMPSWLHVELRANAEYNLLFADRVHKHFFNGGVLMPRATENLWMDWGSRLDRAIVAESARWGDGYRHPAATRDDEWLIEQNWLRDTYFPQRSAVVLQQFLDANLYPNVTAPSFNQHGGEVPAGFDLTINAPFGTIYYTTNGQDPRLFGGAINPNALIFDGGGGSIVTLVGENDSKAVLIPDAPLSDDWKSDPYFNDSGWNEYAYVSGKNGGVGYDIQPAYDQYITYDVEAGMYQTHDTCYVRIPFTISEDPNNLEDMTLKVRYDDGFVAYINGQEVARENFDGTPAWDSYATYGHEDDQAVNFENFDVSAYLNVLQQGDNILAIHGLNFYHIPTPSSDFLVSVELMATVASAPPPPDSSIPLNISTCLKTRAKDGSTWSALNEAKFAIGPVVENFRITEMMYHPQDLPDGEPNAEFIELRNIGTETINLNLVTFTSGVDYTFGDVDLPAGDYIVVVKEQSAFDLQYPSFSGTIGGEYIGSLDNGGERIRLEDSIGRTIQEFSYKDGWHDITDGEGFSLRINDPAGTDPNTWGYQRGWSASTYRQGSPGADDTGPQYGDIVINEVLAHSDGYPNDWIELHNTTGRSIDISGWFLSDSGKDDPNLMKYEIPASTSIPANGYIVFTQDDHFGSFFSFSENGEIAYLSSGLDGNAQLTGYREKEDFEASEAEVTFGKYQKSAGTYNFVAMNSNTPGATNDIPKVGPVVISEVMYHPDWLTPPAAGNEHNNEEFEYIEIHNITGTAVDLYDNINGQDVGWKFTDGVDYTFSVGTTIQAGGTLIIARNSAAFLARYGVSAFGEYDGKLSNSGEKVELSRPGEHIWGPNYYYVRVDIVNYSDGSHHDDYEGRNDLWPIDADGTGKSLTRIVTGDYGNDPANWIAAPVAL